MEQFLEISAVVGHRQLTEFLETDLQVRARREYVALQPPKVRTSTNGDRRPMIARFLRNGAAMVGVCLFR
ncbi:MAG: hypothetical protein ACR2PL_14270 [Dehalococcoidia bacterium]